MKIVITGSHGVGKTTLGKQIFQYIQSEENKIDIINEFTIEKASLSKIFSGRKKYNYLPDVAIEAFNSGFSISEDTSLETELWIISKQVELENKFFDNYVTDKCFIDLLAYGIYIFKDNSALIEILKQIAIPHMHKYDLVIYLPTGEFPIEDNGIRSLDPVFQQEIDRVILEIMKENNIPYHRISGSKEERYEQILKLIK